MPHSFPPRRSSDLARMAQYFHIPAPSIEVEALRRSIWSEQERAGLPLDEARRAVAIVESRMIDGERSRRSELRAYAALYRSEEHTSELQSLMRTPYAVFFLKKKTKK